MAKEKKTDTRVRNVISESTLPAKLDACSGYSDN
jgi:hypothetical protein